jgi:methionine-S-sulfoxide reductase
MMSIKKNLQTATFGGGCFWCMVQPFENTQGVTQVISGYAGGTGDNPTYQDYAQKGYVEVIQVTFDPERVSYQTLVNLFFHQIDPTDSGGQFADRGPGYRPVIFYHDDLQQEIARTMIAILQAHYQDFF